MRKKDSKQSKNKRNNQILEKLSQVTSHSMGAVVVTAPKQNQQRKKSDLLSSNDRQTAPLFGSCEGTTCTSQRNSKKRKAVRSERGNMKTVQISEELFHLIAYYFINDCGTPCEYYEDVHEAIKEGIDKKVEAMVRRQIFSDYKTATNATEREKFRQEYLNRVGVLESFRSASECPTEHL